MKIIKRLEMLCVISVLLLLFCGTIVHAAGTKIKIMKGTVTNVAFGSHAGNITVKNVKKEIEFFGNDEMKLRGDFPSVGDKVTIYYQEIPNEDTHYFIKKLINLKK